MSASNFETSDGTQRVSSKSELLAAVSTPTYFVILEVSTFSFSGVIETANEARTFLLETQEHIL